MKRFRRILAEFTACALALTVVCGLNGKTVNGANTPITVDTQTGLVTAENGGVVYLELLNSDDGSERKVKPAEGASLEYDIEVLHGKAYVNPLSGSFDVGDKFTDAVRKNAGKEILEEKYLDEGTYTGSVKIDEISWAFYVSTNCIMLRMFDNSQIKINKMQLTLPLAEEIEIGNMVSNYVVNTNGLAGVSVDYEAGTVSSSTKWGTVYADLYNEAGTARAGYAPQEDTFLYYDFTVETVEHDSANENPEVHAYHGGVRLEPNPWSEKSASAIAKAFMERVAENAGVSLLEGKLRAGEYRGMVDLTDVWKSNDLSNCISINISEYTKLTMRAMTFIKVAPVISEEDVEGGNLLEAYTASVDSNKEGITADAPSGTVTSGNAWGTAYFDLYTAEGDRAEISEQDGTLLYYDFTIEPVEHSLEGENMEVHNGYHSRASIAPAVWADNSDAITTAFTNAVRNNSGAWVVEGKLPAGHYKGTADLSAVWGENVTTDCIAINVGEYTKVTLNEMKFIKLGGVKTVVIVNGNLLEGYKASFDEPEAPETPDNPGGNTEGDDKKDDTVGGDKAQEFTVTDGNVTYKYTEFVDFGANDMYDGSESALTPDKTDKITVYERKEKSGAWISEANMDKEADFSGYNGYLVYDFVVEKGALALSQNFANDDSVNIASAIARANGVKLFEGDKLPKGTYKGVIKLKKWPLKAVTMKTFSAWATDNSSFKFNELKFINAAEVTGENPVKKVVYLDLLPESQKDWAMEFEKRNADISAANPKGWKISVPSGKQDASARAYFSYTSAEDSSLMLCYDFTVDKGEAVISLRSGVKIAGDKEVARKYANGSDSLVLTKYIAAAAGVTPIEDKTYGEDRLPAGRYTGVICLDDLIPESFRDNGYSWWDISVVGEGAVTVMRELAFADGVSATYDIAKTGDSQNPHTAAVIVLISAAAVFVSLGFKKKCY